MLTSIAWRNLWRNPRRTILSLVAVSLPLALVQCMSGMMHGMSDRLVETVTLSEAKALIRALAAEQSILLLSAPGVGKSESVAQVANAAALGRSVVRATRRQRICAA